MCTQNFFWDVLFSIICCDSSKTKLLDINISLKTFICITIIFYYIDIIPSEYAQATYKNKGNTIVMS